MPLCDRRGIGRPDRAARAAPVDRRPRGAAARRDPARARAHGARFGEAACRGDRLDPDALVRDAAVGARIGGAGARVRGAAHAPREARRHGALHHRPCHQGGRHRRAARARAHRRHGALLRGRPAVELPPGACGEEPLRRGERARRLRHDRQGVEGRSQSVPPFPLHS